MKISAWRISIRSVVGILMLFFLTRANGGGDAVRVPGQSGSVPTFAGNAQHTAIYQPAAQNLNTIHWSTSIDLNNTGDLAHYGAPLVTAANTVLVPVKIAGNGFRVDAFDGTTGTAKYMLSTDYVLPTHNWIPVYNPCITTGPFGTRLYYAGRGGTVYHIDNPDSATHGPPVQEVFYTALANYLANATAYNSTIFINTPITADSQGNIFFGYRVQGTAPAPLSTTQSGFARIDPNGNGTYVRAGTAANDANIARDSHNSAPALSNDETTVYVLAKSASTSTYGYLLGLDSTTLATRYRVRLLDPRNGNGAVISDDGTASPTIAPDDDVYIGILSNPGNGSRGFLLRFSADLTMEKTPGGFGWDYTPAIVPASMVPSYKGPSSYLLFCKYNNYAGGDGNGINKIALLDPNATQTDPHTSANGLVEMREVLTVIGPTPDEDNYSTTFPYAVREWCINTAAVNPATNSIFTPNEDGKIHRWNLVTNSFSQSVTIGPGIGQPYVPTVVGPDGTVYTMNGGTLFAAGNLSGVDVSLASSTPDVRTVVTGQPLTFTATISNTGPTGLIPTGTVTFVDFTYHDLTPVTTTLAANVPLDAAGRATTTTSNLAAGSGYLGNHYITATYSGDSNFIGGSTTLVQKVHAKASTTALTSAPNPSGNGQAVTFTATVASSPAGTPVPTDMVTFQEGTNVLGQRPLGAAGTASFSISNLGTGDHTITAVYYSNTVYAASSGSTVQSVGVGPTPTSTPNGSATPTSTPGASATATATPTGTPLPASQAVNLSTRMRVEAGDNAGIGGFIVTGTAPKHVLIRAIGPSLAQSGVTDALADPVLELNGPKGFQPVFNDNWRDDPVQEALILATGIPPSNDLESAIDAILTPGAYTAVVRGNGDTAGVGLVEVYDLEPAVGSRLANISTRALVNTGDDVVIAGFVLGGNAGNARIILRGIGPSLSSLPNALADPTLELRNGNGMLLASNDNWQDDPEQAAEIIGAGLAPSADAEAAIASALPAGLYTAILAGLNNSTGVGVVEVYDLGAP